MRQNRKRSHGIFTPNKLNLTLRTPNQCAKFHQNRIKIAAVGVFTDSVTEVILQSVPCYAIAMRQIKTWNCHLKAKTDTAAEWNLVTREPLAWDGIMRRLHGWVVRWQRKCQYNGRQMLNLAHFIFKQQIYTQDYTIMCIIIHHHHHGRVPDRATEITRTDIAGPSKLWGPISRE